jgi:hypothetical protein
MTAAKEVQQKYFLIAEEMPLFPPLHSHIQHVDLVIPEHHVILEYILKKRISSIVIILLSMPLGCPHL